MDYEDSHVKEKSFSKNMTMGTKIPNLACFRRIIPERPVNQSTVSLMGEEKADTVTR